MHHEPVIDDTWSDEDQQFFAVMDLTVTEQEAHLRTLAESDPDLARRVRNLVELDHRTRQAGFLNLTDGNPDDPITLADSNIANATDTWQDQWQGQRLGAFQVDRHIASGGMGHVFEGHRTGPVRQRVAIKILRERFSPDAHRRFIAESKILGELSHPNILPLIDTGVTNDGLPYLVMPLVIGQPIHHFAQDQQLSVRRRVELLLPVCDALTHAHAKGYLHRDLKPSNILVSTDSHVFVSDFGLAKALTDASADAMDVAEGVTLTDRLLGTPSYLPPEQLRSSGHATIRTDVYGVGATLYALLTGRGPHDGETMDEILLNVQTRPPVRVRQIVPQVPKDLETICEKCLPAEPDRRYESVADLAAELRRFLSGKPIEARPISRTERALRWMNRNKLATSLSATLLIVIVTSFVSLIYLLTLAQRSQQAEAHERERARKLASEFLDATADAMYRIPEGSEDRLQIQKRVAEILRQFVTEMPTDPKAKRDYAVAQYKLALSELELGNELAGRAAMHAAKQLFSELVEEDPDDLQVVFDLAQSQLRTGELTAAFQSLELVSAIPEANKFHRNAFADTCAAFALSNLSRGTAHEALAIASKGEQIARETQHEVDHRDTNQPVDFLKPLGKCKDAKAVILWELGQFEGAFQCAHEAVSIADRLVERNKGRPEFLEYAIQFRLTEAILMFRDGDLQTAIEICLQAERYASQYKMQSPDWRVPVEYFFWTQAMLAELYFAAGDTAAVEHERRAIDTLDEHVVRFNGWPDAMTYAFYACCARIEEISPETEHAGVSRFLGKLREDESSLIANAILAWFIGDLDTCREQLALQPREDLDGLGLFVTSVLDSAVCDELGQVADANLARIRAEEQLVLGGVSPHYALTLRMRRFFQQVVDTP